MDRSRERQCRHQRNTGHGRDEPRRRRTPGWCRRGCWSRAVSVPAGERLLDVETRIGDVTDAVARILLEASPQHPPNGRRRGLGSAAQFGSFVMTAASVSVTPRRRMRARRSTSRTARTRMPRRRLACRRLCRAPVPAPCRRRYQDHARKASTAGIVNVGELGQGRRRAAPRTAERLGNPKSSISRCRLAAA